MTTPADIPATEAERLAALQEFEVLDTAAEKDFDDLVQIASKICGTPIALVSLIDEQRQWFKARVGLDAAETPRDIAFCSHAILHPEEIFEVRDASQDERFKQNPLVTADPDIRFYAGAPLVTDDGHSLGTLCVIDRKPGMLTEEQREVLHVLARQVVVQLNLRHSARLLNERYQQLAEQQLQLEAANERLEALSRTDPLTGLLNRRGLDTVLTREISRSERYGAALTCLMMDVDHFKAYNDTCGHPAGDIALATIAGILKAQVRDCDSTARYGGEEFAAVLTDTDVEGALAIAERVRAEVESFAWPLQPVTISIGVAGLGVGSSTPSALIRAADIALYECKGAGRNRVMSWPIDEFLASHTLPPRHPSL